MERAKNVYEYSFFVMKHHVCRIIAAFCFLIACGICCGSLMFLVDACLEYTFVSDQLQLEKSEITLILSVAFVLLLFFVLSPLALGIKRWYYQLVCGEETNLSQSFYYFSRWSLYGKALWLQLNLLLRKGITYGIIFSVLALFHFGIGRLEQQLSQNIFLGILYGISVVLYLLFIFAGVLGGFYWNLRYSLAEYLFFENPNGTVQDTIKLSVKKMSSGKREWLKLYLSLLPFYFICILILPIIVLIPYMSLLLGAKGKMMLMSEEMRGEESCQF